MQMDDRELDERRALHAETATKVFARNAKEAEMNRKMSRHLEGPPINTGTEVMKSNVETKTLSQTEDEVPLAIRKKALLSVLTTRDDTKVVSNVVNDVINRKDRQAKPIGHMFDIGSKFSGKALKKTKPRVESKKQIHVKASGKSSKKEKPKDKEIPDQVIMPNKRKGKQIVTENQPPKKKQTTTKRL